MFQKRPNEGLVKFLQNCRKYLYIVLQKEH